jgi:hypothetical protein
MVPEIIEDAEFIKRFCELYEFLKSEQMKDIKYVIEYAKQSLEYFHDAIMFGNIVLVPLYKIKFSITTTVFEYTMYLATFINKTNKIQRTVLLLSENDIPSIQYIEGYTMVARNGVYVIYNAKKYNIMPKMKHYPLLLTYYEKLTNIS